MRKSPLALDLPCQAGMIPYINGFDRPKSVDLKNYIQFV
jgi:hypothetical protein